MLDFERFCMTWGDKDLDYEVAPYHIFPTPELGFLGCLK
jgi:hypothetical protein